MRYLVTGAAGFIGSTVSQRLIERGDTVYGIDNLNDYYDVRLKQARLDRLQHPSFTFAQLDVSDRTAIAQLFKTERIDVVIHLAAQAGVRYSLEHPEAYIDSNLVGFGAILEGARHAGVRHLVYASSSSVYGANAKLPFSEHDPVNHPLSLYAATKKANELMAHCYSHLFQLPTTGLRFFTVYGPWGRPDMALFTFTKKILAGEPIQVFNNGKMVRDFTFIDDIVEGILRVADHPAQANAAWSGENPDPATSTAPYRVYNIGNSRPVQLMKYIEVLEAALGVKAKLDLLPMQPGDVPATAADTTTLNHDLGFVPKVTVDVGVRRFVDWYQSYYQSHEAAVATTASQGA